MYNLSVQKGIRCEYEKIFESFGKLSKFDANWEPLNLPNFHHFRGSQF